MDMQHRFEEINGQVKDQPQKCASKIALTDKTFYGKTVHFIKNECNHKTMGLDLVSSYGQHTGKSLPKCFMNV